MQKADDNFRKMYDAIDGNTENATDSMEGAGTAMQKDGDPGMFDRWQQKAEQSLVNEPQANMPEKMEESGTAGRDNADMQGHHEGARNLDSSHDAGRQESHSNASGDSAGNCAKLPGKFPSGRNIERKPVRAEPEQRSTWKPEKV